MNLSDEEEEVGMKDVIEGIAFVLCVAGLLGCFYLMDALF